MRRGAALLEQPRRGVSANRSRCRLPPHEPASLPRLAFSPIPAKIEVVGVEPYEWAKAHFFVGRRLFLKHMRHEVVSKIEEIAQRVAASGGIEVVEVEFKGSGGNQLVRISIDKPEGVTHADCELVSQQVGTILDVEDVVPGHYTLEVSSPGVERKLLKPNDYIRFQGKKAKIVLRQPVENQRHLQGTLAGLENGTVSLDTGAGRVLRFPLNQVERANLKFEW